MKTKILVLGTICLFLFLFYLPLEAEKAKTIIEQKIFAIDDNESIARHISIQKIERTSSTYQIWITLKNEPYSYAEVRTWTDAVCKDTKKILNEFGVVEDISVWARRSAGKGKVVIYGRTYYWSKLKRFEFKNAKELF